jgi:hypothetical protein
MANGAIRGERPARQVDVLSPDRERLVRARPPNASAVAIELR